MRKIRVGSRESKLAVIQAQIIIDTIKKHHPELEFELITMKTTGDKILDKTLDKIGGKGLFVKELDKALLNKEIDIAVHSLKDMPMNENKELPILAYSKREDAKDVMILPKGTTTLNSSLPIGCSSLRRTLQIKKIYPHMEIKPIRGNVLTRLKKLDRGEYSALILAAAGIKRLGLKERISREFRIDEILPAAGQGIIAVQGRKGENYDYLSCVNDIESETIARCERAFIKELNGGCTSPVAAYATIKEDLITLHCLYEDGKKASYQDNIKNGEKLGIYAARQGKVVTGKVWLVGAGPGDVELLTLKAKRVLNKADVVVYDRLVSDGVLSFIPQKAKKIYVGKQAGEHTVAQDRINEILLEEAKLGRNVVRLKGGDPFVFGRGGEELELLVEDNIPFEIVPGITSAISVPAYQGIPVTYRDYSSSLHIITGHKKLNEPLDIDFEALLRLKGTLVFLMSVSTLKEICDGLLRAGMSKDMPAAILENGTKACQRKVVSTLEHLYDEGMKENIQSPSILVVGKVCDLSDKFSWYDKMPLSGCKVIITRPKDQSSRISDMLRRKGAEVLEVPSIETKRIEDNQSLYECLNQIQTFQWIVLTSPAGAKIFFEELHFLKIDIRKLSHIKFAVVGKATSQVLEEKGIYPEIMPTLYYGRELGKLLASNIKDNEKIFIARAKEGTKDLIEILSKTNARLYDVAIYETIYVKPISDMSNKINHDYFDYAVFTSASTVEGFVHANKELEYSKVTAICIGEKTKEAADKYKMITYVSDEATLESIVECLEEVHNNRNIL